MNTLCVCGGGSLGHVIAGMVPSKEGVKVNILTRKPEKWQDKIEVFLPDGKTVIGNLNKISSDPNEVISEADVILFCLPGYAIPEELDKISNSIKPHASIGTVFSSTGFFQEAFKKVPDNVSLFGFQRVPYVSRIEKYGVSAHLLGYKDMLHLAVERSKNPENLRQLMENWLGEPVKLLNSWMEAAITNSNPLLHTSRLYTMFKDWKPGKFYDHQSLFYEDWTDEASDCLVNMDIELFGLIDNLPVTKGYLKPILEHYESKNCHELTKKISSIPSFKGIKTPMIETQDGWIPDFHNRYFVEDFEYGLGTLRNLFMDYNIICPTIDKISTWYTRFKINA